MPSALEGKLPLFAFPLLSSSRKGRDGQKRTADPAVQQEENVLRASQYYSGTAARAVSRLGHLYLGHLSTTRPGLDWASESRQLQDFILVCMGRVGNITLVHTADLTILSLENQPRQGSSGHHPEPTLPFWLMHKLQ